MSPSETSAAPPVLQVHFINVGYGDAILLQLPDSSTILIDAGGSPNIQSLIDYLSSKGVQKIDTAILTHPHTNHFEGFQKILARYPIGRFFTNGDSNGEPGYTELMDAIKERGIRIKVLQSGMVLDRLPKDVSIEVLHPADLSADSNGNSLVLWLTFKQVHILFTADIGEPQQEYLVKTYDFIKRAQCVQIPHHGGPISGLFARVFENPVFIISTGENKWGWPKKNDLDKLSGRTLRTDQNGTIVLESDGEKLRILSPAGKRQGSE